MSQIIATRNRRILGGWEVPVGAVIKDELKACDHCGHDINVLTVATADGPVVMADDIHDRADENETICSDCLTQFGPEE